MGVRARWDVDELLTRRAGIEVLWLRGLAELGADVVVTTRDGGVSHDPYRSLNLGDHVGDRAEDVAENRRRLARALGVPVSALAFARQVHGAASVVAREGGDQGEADVLVTDRPEVVLCLLVADCVPIAILEPVARVLAVVHAGWRGTVAGAAPAAVAAAVELGARPDRCRAVLGPSISAASYEVGSEVVDAFVAAGLAAAVLAEGGGRHTVDLRAANAAQLVAAGLPATNVGVSDWSTDGGDTFFSDRSARPCGRVAMAARLARRPS